MKKTLAIVLSMVMLLCCIPFSVASAATVTFDESGMLGSSTEFTSGTEYIIPSGVIMEIPSGNNLYIPTGVTLTVKEGGRLDVNGSIVVLSGGKLKVEGKLNGASSVAVNDGGSATALIRFANLNTIGGLVESGKSKINVSYGYSSSGNIYEDLEGSIVYSTVPVAGMKAEVPINQYLYIKAEIVEPDPTYDKFDDSLMNVYLNGVGVPYAQGTHHTLVTTSADVSYSSWINDEQFLNTFNIYLPTGEGYTVYGREGEQSADGETVKLKYGQHFSFKVEIDPEYDMSSYEVYVYNGYGWTNLDTSTLLKDIAPAVPDEYGYYHINEIKGEHTIYVVGVVKNETLLMVGDILDMVRNIFEMITEFFKELVALLGIELGGTTEIV